MRFGSTWLLLVLLGLCCLLSLRVGAAEPAAAEPVIARTSAPAAVASDQAPVPVSAPPSSTAAPSIVKKKTDKAEKPKKKSRRPKRAGGSSKSAEDSKAAQKPCTKPAKLKPRGKKRPIVQNTRQKTVI